MKTVQMTLDEDLVNAVDQISKKLHTSRSAFTRMALREALDRYNIKELERKHQEGYRQHPVSPDEFSIWESEQSWG
ncbi:ribbon-helix-helix domain-containing protein [Desulfobotulus mexicanus]|uniref:Ribbon-helix-helix protein, CopG family n=1 Tax=Desulfobotulus mexicanus TaxID=2586642 RepID=A0A5Q4VAR3_9BACT|nr:ribbon-helix-helix domain-containing protein [Desulfobotulus mexicanus]TYT74844.1 ribbon-helix-helix protein, CopG family [Desulfobotulus mexicanus]